MKKLLSILFCFAALTAIAGLQTINIYSPTSTNLTPMNGTITIPGVITNAPFTIVSNLITGDPQSLAWSKANNNWAYQQAEILWNSNAIAGGLGYGTGSGTLTNGNYIIVINGAGANLTITNSLTLVDANDPYLTIGSLDPIVQNLTNWDIGYYPTNSSLTGLTNAYGFSVGNLFPPTCGNSNGPFALDLAYSFPLITNACGWMMILNFTATNFAGPYSFDTDFDGVLTNQYGAVVLTAGVCPSKNGPYYPAPAYGPTSFTNCCGNVLTVLTGTTNFIYAVDSIFITNNTPALYTNLDAARLVFIATNRIEWGVSLSVGSGYAVTGGGIGPDGWYPHAVCYATAGYSNANGDGWSLWIHYQPNPTFALYGFWADVENPSMVSFAHWSTSCPNGVSDNSSVEAYPNTVATIVYATCWATYISNTWSFYAATNVTFTPLPGETVSVVGTVSNLFNVTTAPNPPTTNTLYVADNGNGVMFNETNVGWWSVGPGGRIFRSAPPTYQLSFIISAPAPPGSYSFPNRCNPYLIAQVGGVQKYMVHGLEWMNTLQQVSNFGNPTNNIITITTTGNATVYLLGKVVYTASWSDGSAWSTSIPTDACSFSPMSLPCIFMPADLGKGGTTVIVP